MPVEIPHLRVPPSPKPCLRLSIAGGHESRRSRQTFVPPREAASFPRQGSPSSRVPACSGNPCQIGATRRGFVGRTMPLYARRCRKCEEGHEQNAGESGRFLRALCHALRRKRECSAALLFLGATHEGIRAVRDRCLKRHSPAYLVPVLAPRKGPGESQR